MATTKTELVNNINGDILVTKTSAPFDSFSWDTTGYSGNVDLVVKWYVDGVLVETSAVVSGTEQVSQGGSYHPVYQAKLDHATANGIPLPTTAQSDIYNQRVIDFETEKGFANVDAVVDWSGEADILFKLIDMKRLVSLTKVGNITNSNTGLVGAGGYIDWNFVMNTGTNYQFNNAGIFTILNTNPAATVNTYGVVGDNNRNASLLGNRPSGSNYYPLNTQDGANGSNSQRLQKVGANSQNRENGTEVIYKTDVTTVLPIVSNDVRPDRSMFAFAENNKGTARNNSTIEIGFMAIGSSFAAAHDGLKAKLEI
ncbi:hypothetical protein [uncultured Christiangramia sp.]|uniref:hypothetical protein n=1 Tax=uncultured Christiangramia sp. TaxID=503836 RepID=UPI00261D25FC|nr:hypothetical protein [uncultured Christiangramia sp.]